jgi:photosystem I P700 chlorophyll a apoprotein A2
MGIKSIKSTPIAHAIWDPHFGQPAVKAFSKGNSYPVNIATSGVIPMVVHNRFENKPRSICKASIILIILSCVLLFAGWLHLQPKFRPGLSWFKNNESRLNHHLSGLFGLVH